MKRIFSFVIILLILSASFLMGYWYKARDTISDGSAGPLTQTSVAKEDTVREIPPDEGTPGVVRVSPERQQLLGVQTEVVRKVSETVDLRVLGRVAADETRVYKINMAVEGWIRQTFNNSTGSLVKKDEPLLSFYSPEFRSAQQSYIFGLGAMDRFKAEGKDTPGQTVATQYTVQQYIDTLKNLGMGDLQIEEIGRTRRATQDILIRSPAAGFIISRNVSLGQRFEKGTELYRIADLSRVWILADLFENEARYLRPGTIVKVNLPQQKKVFRAKVSDILPQFDPTTRTLKVRLEADNPGYMLRPDMFVDVELPMTFPPTVTILSSAILDAGLRKTVFVARGNGFFDPRQVETGWRFGDRVEIKSGLKSGERIVVSGNFLIDSESKMELAASGMYGTVEKDPVCGADIAVRKAEKAGRTSIYRGKPYYFSSIDCKRQFEKNPDRYTEKSLKGNDNRP